MRMQRCGHSCNKFQTGTGGWVCHEKAAAANWIVHDSIGIQYTPAQDSNKKHPNVTSLGGIPRSPYAASVRLSEHMESSLRNRCSGCLRQRHSMELPEWTYMASIQMSASADEARNLCRHLVSTCRSSVINRFWTVEFINSTDTPCLASIQSRLQTTTPARHRCSVGITQYVHNSSHKNTSNTHAHITGAKCELRPACCSVFFCVSDKCVLENKIIGADR